MKNALVRLGKGINFGPSVLLESVFVRNLWIFMFRRKHVENEFKFPFENQIMKYSQTNLFLFLLKHFFLILVRD